MKPLLKQDIRHALTTDKRFRDLFPEFKEDIEKYLNSSCSCNNSLLDKLYQKKEELKKYFPNKEIIDQSQENNWKVLSCHIDELEGKLKKLHKYGKKQIALSRYEDQITVLINELD